MAKRLFIKYGSLRQDTHDAPTGLYDPATFNFGYELEIHDRDFTGTALPISEISSDGAVISQKGGSDMNKVIVPSVLDFTMYVNSAGEDAFVEDLIDGDEERFTVRLYHRQELLFVGYILIEQVSQDIKGSYRSLNITATDGLSRMKEVKYPAESPKVEAIQRFGWTNTSGSDQYIDITFNYDLDGEATNKVLQVKVTETLDPAIYGSSVLVERGVTVAIGVITNLTFDTITPPSGVVINAISIPEYRTILTETYRIGYPTFMETVVRCFEESGVSKLYSDTHPMINVYTNWEEGEMDFTNATRRGLLDQMSCQSNLFLNIKEETGEDGEVSVTSSSSSSDCHKVLRTILTILHCKMFYENGRYYIRHSFGSEAANREMNYKSYQSDGTYISEAIMDKSKDLGYRFEDDLRLISPASTKYIAPYKYCEVELNAAGSFVGLNSDIIKAPDYEWRSFNYFLVGEVIRLSIDFFHSFISEDSGWINASLVWDFEYQVRVGSKYLSMDLDDQTGGWSSDTANVVKYRPSTNSPNMEDYLQSSRSFFCDPLLEEGDLELRIFSVQVSDSVGQTYYKSTLAVPANTPDISVGDWEIDHSMQVKLVTQNEDHNGKFTYRSSESVGNSRVKNIKTTLGELDQVVDNPSQIYTWNETEGEMVPYRDADLILDIKPVRDWGGGAPLMRKLLNSYSTTHSKPKEILVGSIDDTKNSIDYNTVIEWMGKDYMAISLKRITSKDRYTGQWIEIGKTLVDNSSDNVDIFYVPTRNGFLGSGIIGGVTNEMLQNNAEQNDTSLGGNLLFSRSYIISDSDTAQIINHTIPLGLSTTYTIGSIHDSYILYVNGVRWRYVNSIGQVTKAGLFTLEEDSINWKLFRAIDAEIRLEVWDRLIVDTSTNS